MEKSFCLLTPPGRSAVATTLVRGDAIADLLKSHFVTAKRNEVRLELLRPKFGFWVSGGEPKEGLVICLLHENAAEIHSHGGMIAPKMIADSLKQSGFEEIAPEQLVRESCSTWQSDVRLALLNAPTERTAKRLLRLEQQLPNQLSRLLEDLESNPSRAEAEIQCVLEYAGFGIHLSQPWKVVICGQPNVGKSSLINALSGFARAIVHDSPGTTRDVVSQITAIEGWPVELTDTAGIRETEQEIERQGVVRTIQELELADLRIAIFDSSKPWSQIDQSTLEQVKADLVVHNKCDQQVDDPNRPDGIFISATQPTGLKELLNSVAKELIPVVPPDDQWLVVNSLQRQKLEQLLLSLRSKEGNAVEVGSSLLG